MVDLKKNLYPYTSCAQRSQGSFSNGDTVFKRTDWSVGHDFIPVHLYLLLFFNINAHSKPG